MSHDLTGRVAAVDTIPLGDVLAADAPAGSSTLVVEDTADFSEEGGHLSLSGAVIAYLGIDDETGTITLDEGTPADAFAGDRVEAWDLALNLPITETVAHVEVEGTEQGGDTLEAIVDHALIPFLPEGIRDTSIPLSAGGEAVELEWRGDDLYVVNIVGRAPVMDGAMIDPDTLPAPSTDPTTAPGSSPTLIATGTPSSVVLRASEVEPTTSIEYHASTTDGFTPDSSTLLATTRSTVLVAATLPDGSPLVAGSTYYFRAVAKNIIGPAPAGAQVEGQLDLAAVRSVVAEEVSAGFVLAGRIEVGNITIEPDGGITIPLANGKIIRFPADGAEAEIAARLRTSDLIVDGGLVVNGSSNKINGSLQLAAGLGDPSTLPSVGSDNKDVVYLAAGLSGSPWFTGLAKSADGTQWLAGNWNSGGVSQLRLCNATTGATMSVRDLGPSGDQMTPVSIARSGSTYYVVGARWNATAARNEWRMHRYDQSLNLLSGVWLLSSTGSRIPVNDAYEGSVAVDAADGTVWFAHRYSADERIAFRNYSTGGTYIATTFTPVGSFPASGTTMGAGLYVGTADVGTRYFYTTIRGTAAGFGNRVAAWSSAGARTSSQDFAVDRSANGLYWDGTRFYSAVSQGVSGFLVQEYSTQLGTTLEVAYDYYDSDPTGGNRVSLPSPRLTTTTIRRRDYVYVGTPAAPDDGGVDGADTIRVYTTATVGGTLRLVQTRSGATYVNDWLPEARVNPAGAVPSATNTFGSSGALGRVQSAALDGTGPLISLDGTGAARLANLTTKDGDAGTGTFRDSMFRTPAARVRRTASQTMTSAASTVVSWDTTEYARGGCTTSSSGITLPIAGLYEISAQAGLATSNTGGGIMHVSVQGSSHGTVVVGRNNCATSGGVTMFGGNMTVACAAGDVITFAIFHNNGADRALQLGSYETALSVRWVGTTS